MSKKLSDLQSQGADVPFFAHLLTAQNDPAATTANTNGGSKPTYPCVDTLCTKKYPSDDDESSTGFGDTDW